jgi:hypothetical protein
MNIFNIIEKERKRNRELFYHNFNGFPSKCKLCKKIRLIRENTWVSIKEKCPVFDINAYIIQKNYKLYILKKRMPVLWKIAEYYTSIKYHPNKIYKYIDF